ncbi:MAG: hypothetical protein FWG99_03995 [Treponema sp.]|nr:hypothetical protein [Treponema sp.]
MIIKNFFLCTALILLCGGCISLVEKTGRVLDGSTFAEKKIAVYRASISEGAPADMEISIMENKAAERSIVIVLNKFGAMRLRGSYPEPNGDFFLTSMEYLGGNEHGWNEFNLELSAVGRFLIGVESAIISIPTEIETVQISAGRIHRYDTRITGDEALTSLRNRNDRIAALCEWIRGKTDTTESVSKREFEREYKPVLFPETVSKKLRPAGWQRDSDSWVRAESIRWNTGYTERIFPAELRQIRNTGTLLRDWEEALDWIYLEYEWENIKRMLSHGTILYKIK